MRLLIGNNRSERRPLNAFRRDAGKSRPEACATHARLPDPGAGAEHRKKVAHGVSRGLGGTERRAPEGRKKACRELKPKESAAPAGAFQRRHNNPRLTPWATLCRRSAAFGKARRLNLGSVDNAFPRPARDQRRQQDGNGLGAGHHTGLLYLSMSGLEVHLGGISVAPFKITSDFAWCHAFRQGKDSNKARGRSS